MRRLAMIAALFCALATLSAGLAFAEPANPLCRKDAPSGFLGSETLHFAVKILVGFINLTDAAEANIFAEQVTGTRPSVAYLGLTASAKGIAFIFSRLRQEHRSRAVEWVEQNSLGPVMFATTRYELFQEGGNKPQLQVFEADYQKRVLTRLRRVPSPDGYKESKFKWIIPKGAPYQDPLTVLFNLRHGRYGLPKQGEEMVIRTFPFEGDDAAYDEIRIRQASAKDDSVLILVDVPAGFLREDRRITVKVLFDRETLTPRWAEAVGVVPFFDGDATGSFVCFG